MNSFEPGALKPISPNEKHKEAQSGETKTLTPNHTNTIQSNTHLRKPTFVNLVSLPVTAGDNSSL